MSKHDHSAAAPVDGRNPQFQIADLATDLDYQEPLKEYPLPAPEPLICGECDYMQDGGHTESCLNAPAPGEAPELPHPVDRHISLVAALSDDALDTYDEFWDRWEAKARAALPFMQTKIDVEGPFEAVAFVLHPNPGQVISVVRLHRAALATVAERERTIGELRAQLIEAEAADRMTDRLYNAPMPCGHAHRYGFTQDGGKHGLCLHCEVTTLRERERQLPPLDESVLNVWDVATLIELATGVDNEPEYRQMGSQVHAVANFAVKALRAGDVKAAELRAEVARLTGERNAGRLLSYEAADSLTCEQQLKRLEYINSGLCNDHNTLLISHSRLEDRAQRAEASLATAREALTNISDAYAHNGMHMLLSDGMRSIARKALAALTPPDAEVQS